jgi:hypothetical protein
MASCSKIAANILYACANMVAGIKDVAYFINIDDVDKDSSTFDPENPLLLTQLVLLSGSPTPVAHTVEGHNYSNEHDTALLKGVYYNSWEHNFRFRIFDNSPEVKLWVNTAVGSRFLVIQENNYSNTDSPAGRTVFEVLGWDFGLEVKEAVRVAADAELAGGWNILAACSEKLKESKPPLAFFVGGSITATRAAIASLVEGSLP